MNLRQIEYFVAIADTGSITRAASELIVAQPSISQQLKSLEVEVGGRLFERLPSGIQLTAAGHAFLPHARAALQQIKNGGQAARVALDLDEGELEVATVTSIAYGVLPGVFSQWKSGHPRLRLRLQEFAHRGSLRTAVAGGVGDVAVGPRPDEWTGPVFSLGWERFLLILPSSDPLADDGSPVSIEALSDRDWVTFHPDHGLSEIIRFVCARAGFAPHPAVETGQIASAASLAAAGLGVTLLPANVISKELANAVREPAQPIAREVTAFTRHDPSELTHAFVDVLRDQHWDRRPKDALVIA